jgi:hypothetical protein
MFATIAALGLISVPNVALQARFEPFANLAYQLDSVSGHSPQSQSENFSALWREKFLLSDEDRNQLEAWRKVRRSNVENSQESGDFSFPMFPVQSAPSLDTKVRIAGLISLNEGEYTATVRKLTNTKDAETLAVVIRHFQPRFQKWWDAEALPKGQKFLDQTKMVLARESIQTRIDQFARFYEANFPAGTSVPFQLIYKPNTIPEGTSGEQVANVALMEFMPRESAAMKVEVAIHELCHYFYGRAPAKKHRQLQRDFINLPSGQGLPVLNVLNEALATTLGNGMIAEGQTPAEDFRQYREAPMTWYGWAEIDGAAKGSYDWLKDYMAKGGKLFDRGFAKAYTEVVRRGLGSRVEAPPITLMSMQVLCNDRWSSDIRYSFASIFRANFFTSSTNTTPLPLLRDVLKEKSGVSVVLLLTPEELGNAIEMLGLGWRDRDEIQSELRASDGACYVHELPNHRLIYLFAGRQESKIRALSEKLLKVPGRIRGLMR